MWGKSFKKTPSSYTGLYIMLIYYLFEIVYYFVVLKCLKCIIFYVCFTCYKTDCINLVIISSLRVLHN